MKTPREYLVICPGCLTFETLWFKGNIMDATRKFTQDGDDKVYHDCKLTDLPCRLYQRFIEEVKVSLSQGF